MQPDFFGKKSHSGVQKWYQKEVFKFYEKSAGAIFLIFCIKLQQHKVLKLNSMIFYGKNLVLRFSGQKGPKFAQSEVFQLL